MSIPIPNLDDRTWKQLMVEAQRFVSQRYPAWTDRSPSDPGIVLVEVFAYITEILIFRLNRLPDKAYVQFLRLMGVSIEPPTAATVRLTFSRPKAGAAVTIPAGTAVTVARKTAGGELPVFSTLEDVELGAEATEVEAWSIHGELRTEVLGEGSGRPGQTFTVSHAPIVRPVERDSWNLVLGVEVAAEEEVPPGELIDFGVDDDKRYRVWREVENFTRTDERDRVFVVDRNEGRVTFAPALQVKDAGGELGSVTTLLGAAPGAGRDVVVAYRTGGGVDGNVAEGTLTVLKTRIGNLQVTNRLPARGGNAVESLANALERGPLELRSPKRAVTARDYEEIALRSGAINRARAFTKSEIWSYALPGTVEVLLVPQLSADHGASAPVSLSLLQRLQEDSEPLQRVAEELNARRPIGTLCEVRWAHYKSVQVKARVVIQRETDRSGIQERVIRRLRDAISPVRVSTSAPGGEFGRTLHVSNIYDICLSEPGVTFVDRVALRVDEAPEQDVIVVVADAFQRGTWYTASGSRLFRSGNDGHGWELIQSLPLRGETVSGAVQVRELASHPQIPGRVAAVAKVEGEEYRIYVSEDCGESWRNLWNPAAEVRGIAWAGREPDPAILVATDQGLYRVAARGEAPSPTLLTIDGREDTPLLAIAVSPLADGDCWVAVAAAQANRIEGGGGVFISRRSGAANTFERVDGSTKVDIVSLAFQHTGSVGWLWAGTRSVGSSAGDGCLRWELGVEVLTKGAQTLGKAQGWEFGTCFGLASNAGTVWASTLRGGVVRVDTHQRELRWVGSSRDSGLPLDVRSGNLASLEGVASARAASAAGPTGAGATVLTCGAQGVYHSFDGGQTFRVCSRRDFSERVTLPATWLACSGDHEIEVVNEDELGGL